MSIASKFKELGKTLKASHQNPLSLNTNSVLFVVKGTLNIFSTSNEANSKPSFLFNLQAGECAFGFKANNPLLTRSLLAIGTPNTEIIQCSITETNMLLSTKKYREDLCPLLNNWIILFSKSISKSIQIKPTISHLCDPSISQELILFEDDTLSAKKSVCWISNYDGELLYLDMESLPVDTIQIFPLTSNTWLQANTPTQIKTHQTSDIITSKAFFTQFNYFQETLLLCDQWNINLEKADDLNQLNERKTKDTNHFHKSLNTLASICNNRIKSFSIKYDDALVETIFTIAKWYKIPFSYTPITKPKKDLIKYILESSKIRYRHIHFDTNCISKYNQAFLGFLKENNRPVCILPSKNKAFVIIDYTEKKVIPFNKIKEQLQSNALEFIRPLDTLKNMSIINLIKFSLSNKYKDLFILFLSACLSLIANIFIAWSIIYCFNEIIPHAETHNLIQTAIALIAAISISCLSYITFQFSLLNIIEKIDLNLQLAIFDRLLNLPSAFFRNHSVAQLTEKALGLFQFRKKVSPLSISILISGLSSSLYFIPLFFINTFASIFSIITYLCYIIILSLLSRSFYYASKQSHHVSNKLSSFMLQLINGLLKIHSTHSKLRVFKRFSTHYINKLTSYTKMHRIKLYIHLCLLLYAFFTLSCLFYYFANITAHHLSIGSFLAYFYLISFILLSTFKSTKELLNILETVPHLSNIAPILQNMPESYPVKKQLEEPCGNIEFVNVNFRYKKNQPLVLKNLSFIVEPGKFHAITGLSGSGKSTIFRLLLGFEKSESGAIYFDKHNINKLDMPFIRQQIGCVLQTSSLLPGNILTNIAGSNPVSIDDIWAAANIAGIDGFISSLPMGLHTIVSENGNTFSNGQIQSILMAKALVNKPKILLLDEATSSLDSLSQDRIMSNLDNLQITRLVIAHRKETLKNADFIIEL